MSQAVFRRDGDRFIPTRHAASPWGSEVLHGGPPAALLARAVEREVKDPALRVARLTIDLFRAVPLAPLEVRAEPVRSGRRIAAIQASLLAEGVEVTRAHALLLRQSPAEPTGVAVPPPPGPDGLETTSLSRQLSEELPPGMPTGFHTLVETRWVTRRRDESPPTVWFRIPIPLIEREEPTPLQRAAALADFGNALANIVGYVPGEVPAPSMINTDISLYLLRPPEGEWICLQADYRAEVAGVGLVEVAQFDEAGRFGRSVQARLANPRRVDRSR